MTCEQCGGELSVWDRRADRGKVCAACRASGPAIDWDALLARVEASMRAWRVFAEAEQELP